MEDEALLKKNGPLQKPMRRLNVWQKTAYGVGHVMNDICAAMWFSYTLLFFHIVLDMPATLAGVMLLIGQVADAVATPIVGVYADRIGTRKAWHLVGTGMVVFSFPLIFSPCPGCQSPTPLPLNTTRILGNSTDSQSWSHLDTESLWLRGFYYSVLIILFQAGWATVQISHLALIPDLTPIHQERAELTAIRYTASVCSSVLMYLVTWLILHITAGDINKSIGTGDAFKFRDIVIIGTVVGGAFSATFHFVLKVPRTYARKEQNSTTNKGEPTEIEEKSEHVKFCTPVLYLVSILYVASRLYLTLSLVYVPLYVAETLDKDAESLATVPLVSYLASFLASVAVKYCGPHMSSKVLYLIGVLLSLIPCVWIGVGVGYISQDGELYSVAILMGAGSSVTMVSSLCYAADLIGTHTESGALVYSVVTFADKLLNGVAVMLIQYLQCECILDCPNYYRQVLSVACGSCALFGLGAVLALWKNSLGQYQGSTHSELRD